MKILIINPPITGEERYGKFSGVGGYSPPLGLCYIGAVLEKAGHEVKLIDAIADELTLEQLKSHIISISPDMICATAMTLSAYKAFALFDAVKKIDKSIITVLGGPHISALPEETMERCKHIDYGVVGEGEETIFELVDALEKKKEIKYVKGLIYLESGKITKTAARPLIKDLDSIPFPARHLLRKLERYHPTPQTYRKLPVTTMITSRGCPYTCNFCDKSIFGVTPRLRSVDSVISEVEHLIAKYKIKEITFEDDTFSANKKRTLELCKRLEHYGITFTIASRVNVLDKEVIHALKKAGCWQIAMGVESGNQRILDLIGKGITINQIKNAVTETEKAGIQSKGFFMIGHPGETEQTINETINLATSIPLSQALFTLVTPYPSTPLFEQAKKYGTFRTTDWADYGCWDAIFLPKGLSVKTLKKYHTLAYKKFYFRPSLAMRHLKYIKGLHDIKRYYLGAKAVLSL